MSRPSTTSPPPVIAASRTRLVGAALLAVVLIALAIAWTVTPLSRILDPQVLAGYQRQARDWPLAPLAVVAIHVASGFVAAPGILMIGATVVLFGAWPGALYAFAGMLANGITVYAIGRFAARDLVDGWLARHDDSRLDAWNTRLARRGFVAIALLRLAPIPFSLQNVVAGASRIGFVDFVTGTAVGLLPAMILMTGVAAQFAAWLAHPDWRGLAILIGATLVAAVVIGTLGRWALRRRGERQRQ